MSKYVKEIMTPDPTCCMPNTKLIEVARMMAEYDCGEIPVCASPADRRPIGVVTDRDIVIRTLAINANPMDKTAQDCMTQPVITVTPDTRIEECCDVMEQNRIRRIPVVDERGLLVGMVAQADIALAVGHRAAGDMLKQVSQPSIGRH